MLRALPLAPFFVAALPLMASAQSADRYRLERTENGFVRMDTQTGSMSYCKEGSGELICKSASDATAPDSDQVEAMKRRIDALERRVAALEQGLPPGEGSKTLPSEEEFEQTMSFMERFLRRFMGIVKDLDSGNQPSEEPAPDRT